MTVSPSKAQAAANGKPSTPMMAQYWQLKAKAGDCLLFYRMGDFFELFFDDARAAAATLDIALTTRGEHDGAPVPMCGVPVHAAEAYLARLIRAGHRVAIAEQTETPEQAKQRGGSKALVARDIIRFVTAGTLTEETLLDAKRANMLAAITQVQGRIGIAACDISTGVMETEDVAPDDLPAALARIGASEIVASEAAMDHCHDAIPRPARDFDSQRGSARLLALHDVATLDGFGQFSRAMLAAAGGLIAYLEHVGQGSLPFLRPPCPRQAHGFLAMDEATRASLEITASAQGGRSGSLIDAIDRTLTGAGARLLAADLSAPLTDMAAIRDRLAMVGWLHERPLHRAALREALRAIPDLGRALGRLVADRGSPRDLGQIRDGLNQARSLHEKLRHEAERPPLLDALLPLLRGHGELTDALDRALVPMPPTERGQGGYIAPGHDAALDELRDIASNGRRAIAALEARYREQTGVAALKIRHNGVLGYFVEVPAARADALMEAHSGFTHRQTMAGAVRFNSIALHEEAIRIAEAGTRALAAEEAHFEELVAMTVARRTAIAATADALARLDVSASHAERAAEGGWCAPHLAEEPVLEVIGGRHPVVEAALAGQGARFIANDCALSPQSRLWLVSGPNMGGKSTFLRQNALIILLAQAGSFVPASSVRLGLVDRLFSRVGASDNLARGRSTFMVEMVETAAILSQATERSFVILDEVGRGTSTYDGLALAWAIAEWVHEQNRCRCLFATHYHELTRLAETLDALSLHHVRAREWKGDLVLLHELGDGPADRSYGLAVAKLAGVPAPVLKRAKSVLDRLEKGKAQTGGLAAGLDDLPLFAAALEAEAVVVDPLRQRLDRLDIDTLSPRDALELLYELKDLAGEAEVAV